MALDPLEQMMRDRQRAMEFARSRGINLGQQPTNYGFSVAQSPTAPNYAGPPPTMPQMQQPTQGGLGLQPPRATVRGGGRPMSPQAQAWRAAQLNPAAPAQQMPPSAPAASAPPTGFMGRMMGAAGKIASGYGIGQLLNRPFGPAFDELDARAALAFGTRPAAGQPVPNVLTPPLIREAEPADNLYPGGLQKRMANALPPPESLRDPVMVGELIPAGEPETISGMGGPGSGIGFRLPEQRPRLRANRTAQPVAQMNVPDVPVMPDFQMPTNINPNDPFAMRQVMLGLQAQMLPYAAQSMQRKAALGFNKQMADQSAAMEGAQAAHDRNTIDVDQALRNEDIWRARTAADIETQRIQSDASMSNAKLAANSKTQEQAWDREKAGAEMMGIQTYNEFGQPTGTRAVPRYQFASADDANTTKIQQDAIRALMKHPDKRDVIVQRLRSAGIDPSFLE